MRIWFAFLLAAVFALSSGAPRKYGSDQQPGAMLALRDANLIDGTGSSARPHVDLLIANGSIRAIRETAQDDIPAGAVLWELNGMTVIPGYSTAMFI